MCDLIDRQAAVDAIKDRYYKYGRFAKKDELIYALEGVPPAQLGTNLAEVGTDTISRQQAIDEIDEWIKAFRENGHKESAADACLIQDGIIQLPPAQPEPCEDAVSRKDAIDGLNDAVHEHNITDFDAVATILALPPVTPKQRMGKWIDDGSELGCQCSECGKSLDEYIHATEYMTLMEIPNFCPNCGAKMEGDAE